MTTNANEPVVGEVRLRNVRLSFSEALFTPKPFGRGATASDDNKPRYSSSFLIDRTRPDFAEIDKEIRAAIKAAAVAKWGDKIPTLKPDKFCYRNGDGEKYDGYKGHMYIAAARPGDGPAPQVVDKDPKVVLTAASGRPYSGCYVNALVRIWAQDNKFGKRINASIEAVQFVRHGQAFGATLVNPSEVFDEVAEDDADFMAPSTAAPAAAAGATEENSDLL